MHKARPRTLRDYIEGVAGGDQTWRELSACRGASPTIVAMFTCAEDETFEMFGEQLSGYHVQSYLVVEYCHTCPVQWECARHAIQHEVDPRYTGAWAMLRRDLRWLSLQDDPLGFIDTAKLNGVSVSVAVRDAQDPQV